MKIVTVLHGKHKFSGFGLFLPNARSKKKEHNASIVFLDEQNVNRPFARTDIALQ